MPRWSLKVIKKAKNLRVQGKNYSDIVKELGVPKSTLSLWFKDMPKPQHLFFQDRLQWLSQIRILAVKAKNDQKKKNMDIIKMEVDQDIKAWKDTNGIPFQKTILAFLYWAEGSKGKDVVTFANTNPHLAYLFITLLRNCFPIDESKLRIRLHLHDYHNEDQVKIFWSDLLKVPLSQFNQTYHKSQGVERKFRRNIGGICFIKYNSVYLQKRITQYSYSLAEKLVGKVNVPVV